MLKHAFRVVALLAVLSGPVQAQFVQGSATGLSGAHATLTFENLGIANNSLVTNQLQAQGVTFANAYLVLAPALDGGFTTTSLRNYQSLIGTSGPVGPITINFLTAVNGAAFNLLTVHEPTNTRTFQAFLGQNSVPVASFTSTIDTPPDPSLFWGFQGVLFDRIVITSVAANGNEILIDNLQIATNTVPEPSTMVLFGLGMIGVSAYARRRGLSRS